MGCILDDCAEIDHHRHQASPPVTGIAAMVTNALSAALPPPAPESNARPDGGDCHPEGRPLITEDDLHSLSLRELAAHLELSAACCAEAAARLRHLHRVIEGIRK